MLIFYKTVDKSVLVSGFTVPLNCVDMLFAATGGALNHGEKRTIKIFIDGDTYTAMLMNSAFDQKKYAGHKDIVQIRYGINSKLGVKLREKFGYSLGMFNEKGNEYNNKWLASLPEGKKEFIAMYSSDKNGTIMFDCLTNADIVGESEELFNFGEMTAESILDGTDPLSGIILKNKLCKIRTLTQSILLDLKHRYKYRCQICGHYIGENYVSNLIHAHHIEYFTQSLNNDKSNIIILCPNHHYIIHDRNPVYNPLKRTYLYPNGYEEGLRINEHL